MGGRKSKTNHIRKIGKTGNVDSPSYFLTIPIELVRDMAWTEGQEVSVKRSRGKIIIETPGSNLQTDLDND